MPRCVTDRFVDDGDLAAQSGTGREEWVQNGGKGWMAGDTWLAVSQAARACRTNRNDARGMADLLRMGWFRPVRVGSTDAMPLSISAPTVRKLPERFVRGLKPRGSRPSGLRSVSG